LPSRSRRICPLASERPVAPGTVSGELPADLVPPVTGAFPLIRTFRIVEPANYARSVFIEALRNAGVQVDASTVAANPVARLPARNSYSAATRVAQLVSFPYAEDAKLILKVSYNLGADTSLVLWGLTRGVDNMADALGIERQALVADHGIGAGDFLFVDGSGGGSTRAANRAVTTFLESMSRRSSFAAFRDALPILGVDGSLITTNAFESDPSLAGAKGKVLAKTGTFVEGSPTGGLPLFRAKASGGYITAKSGRRLAFIAVVNEVGPVADFGPILATVQDLGTISAILWRDN
jgi:D-alanyl-D-alanine carboxypeptidase/D-alanyl-D-alanine-endopeptidase (penicillin-binding protein 4)